MDSISMVVNVKIEWDVESYAKEHGIPIRHIPAIKQMVQEFVWAVELLRDGTDRRLELLLTKEKSQP